MGEDQGGLTPEQQAAIRALALDDARRVPRRRQRRRADADRSRPPPDPRVHGRRAGDRRVPADDARGAGPDRRPARPALAQGRRQPGQAVQGRHHRRRHVGHRRRLPPGRGRRALRRRRQERRRRRHLAGEQLSRLPGRHPEPLLQLLVRPARRLAALLQPALRAATSTSGSASTSSASGPTSASTPRSRRSSTTTPRRRGRCRRSTPTATRAHFGPTPSSAPSAS